MRTYSYLGCTIYLIVADHPPITSYPGIGQDPIVRVATRRDLISAPALGCLQGNRLIRLSDAERKLLRTWYC